jgi:predicted Zn-dependent protease
MKKWNLEKNKFNIKTDPMKTLKLFFAALLIVVSAGCHKETILDIHPYDFLSSDHYEKLVVEVQYPSGYHPTSETVDKLRAFLEARLHKPGGISITLTSIPVPRKDYYSVEDIKKIEDKYSKVRTHRKTLAAYVFFADGAYSGDSRVLGLAYRPTSAVIFEKTVRDHSGGLAQPSTALLESTVLHHEFGHLFGLVNNGTGMLAHHEDTGHPRHCTNSNCLMYHAVETTDIVASLVGDVPRLDQYCLDDLRANGGK